MDPEKTKEAAPAPAQAEPKAAAAQAAPEEKEPEESYEMTPEEATGNLDAPPVLNRKTTMMVLCIAFSIIVGGGLLYNILGGGKKKKAPDDSYGRGAAETPAFLKSQRDRALTTPMGEETLPDPEPLPEVTLDTSPSAFPPPERAFPARQAAPASAQERPVPPPPSSSSGGGSGGGGSRYDPRAAALVSPLTPKYMTGSLFNSGAAQPQTQGYNAGSAYGSNAAGGYTQSPSYQAGMNAADDFIQRAMALRQQQAAQAAQGYPQGYGQAAGAGLYPQTEYEASDPYALQNNQRDKQRFFQAANSGAAPAGRFLENNALWIGTIVPGVLITGINTDLPGGVIARVTENIYDSRTGRYLLIPQGSILAAQYNSSVSYAQHRVQIVWDTLIRPDGFFLELGGMNGVDLQGMSGQAAVYHENWFEYLKAAGIIAMFSIANSTMTEEIAKYASDTAAAAAAQSGADTVNEIGGGIVGRAMNIQPTLTVTNGAAINIMLNRTLYFPPVENYPVTKKYRLE